MDKPQYLVGGHADGERIRGSIQLACSLCGTTVQVAPAGQKHLATNPGMVLICPGCLKKRITTQELGVELRLVHGALEELQQHSLWKQRN